MRQPLKFKCTLEKFIQRWLLLFIGCLNSTKVCATVLGNPPGLRSVIYCKKRTGEMSGLTFQVLRFQISSQLQDVRAQIQHFFWLYIRAYVSTGSDDMSSSFIYDTGPVPQVGRGC